MAITRSNLTSGSSTTNGTSYSTASISPAASNLIVVSVKSQALTAANAAAPTGISGAGLTFVLWKDSGDTTTGQNVSIWRAMDAAPSTGALTLTFTNTQANVLWSVEQVAGDISTSGSNGSGAVNSNTASGSSLTGSGTSATATLAAFSSASNGAFCATCWLNAGAAATCTPDTGWTECTDGGQAEAGVGHSLETQFRSDNDTTATGTWSAAGYIHTVAGELVAATSGGSPALVGKSFSLAGTRGLAG